MKSRVTLAIASSAVLVAVPLVMSATASASATVSAKQPVRAAAVQAAPPTVTPMASNGYQIYSEMNSSMCLTAATAVHGTLIDMEGCDPNNLLQQWKFGPNGNLQSAADTNLCLDDRYNNPGGGAATDLWDCNPWPAQYWTYDNGQHQLTNANNNCLDITDANTAWGAAVKLFPCKGVSNQHWYLR